MKPSTIIKTTFKIITRLNKLILDFYLTFDFVVEILPGAKAGQYTTTLLITAISLSGSQ